MHRPDVGFAKFTASLARAISGCGRRVDVIRALQQDDPGQLRVEVDGRLEVRRPHGAYDSPIVAQMATSTKVLVGLASRA